MNRALVVGINAYGGGNDLQGCLNDAWETAELLEHLGWPHDQIRLVTDQDATRAGILARLEWLMSECEVGDRLVFMFSGHGTRIRDRNGDELVDRLDEALCCHGIQDDFRGSLLLDDDLEKTFALIKPGAFLTVILDACHTGTGTRSVNGFGKRAGKYVRARYVDPPIHVRWRAHKCESRCSMRWFGWGRPDDSDAATSSSGVLVMPSMRHLLLSGCRDDQTSADAFISGRYVGAMSACWRHVMREHPNGVAKTIHAHTLARLRKLRFDQEPQLEGPQARIEGIML